MMPASARRLWIPLVLALTVACGEQDPAVLANRQLDESIRTAERALAEMSASTEAERAESARRLRDAARAAAPASARPAQRAAFDIVRAGLLRAAIRLDVIQADRLEIVQASRSLRIRSRVETAKLIRTIASGGATGHAGREALSTRRDETASRKASIVSELEAERERLAALEEGVEVAATTAAARELEAAAVQKQVEAQRSVSRDSAERRWAALRKEANRARTEGEAKAIDLAVTRSRIAEDEALAAAFDLEITRLEEAVASVESIQSDREGLRKKLLEAADALSAEAIQDAKALAQTTMESLKPLDESIRADLDQCANLYVQAASLGGESGASAKLLSTSMRLALLAHATRRAAHASAEADALDAIQAIASDAAWSDALQEIRRQRDASMATALEASRAVKEGLDGRDEALLATIRSRVDSIERLRASTPATTEAPVGDAPAQDSPDAPAAPAASEPPPDAPPATEPTASPSSSNSDPPPASEPPSDPQ